MLIVISLFENNIYDVFRLEESSKDTNAPYVLNSIYIPKGGIGIGVEDYRVGEMALLKIRRGAVYVPDDIEQRLFFI